MPSFIPRILSLLSLGLIVLGCEMKRNIDCEKSQNFAFCKDQWTESSLEELGDDATDVEVEDVFHFWSHKGWQESASVYTFSAYTFSGTDFVSVDFIASLSSRKVFTEESTTPVGEFHCLIWAAEAKEDSKRLIDCLDAKLTAEILHNEEPVSFQVRLKKEPTHAVSSNGLTNTSGFLFKSSIDFESSYRKEHKQAFLSTFFDMDPLGNSSFRAVGGALPAPYPRVSLRLPKQVEGRDIHYSDSLTFNGSWNSDFEMQLPYIDVTLEESKTLLIVGELIE